MEKSVDIKYLRISAKKLRTIMDDYKGKRAVALMGSLGLQPQRGASIIAKAIKSCLSLFKDTEREAARVKNVSADQGPVFKRWRAGSRGMAKKYSKKTAHLHVTLEVPTAKSTQGK